MCYEPVAILLTIFVIVFAILGHFNFAWTYEEAHGGLWFHCPSPLYPDLTLIKNVPNDANVFTRQDCQKYTQLVAQKFYLQSWGEIIGAKVTLILGAVLGFPILIVIVFQMFNRVPFWVGGMLAVFQFVCLLIAAILMTHGFVIVGRDHLKIGFNTICVWVAAALAFILMIIMFSSKSKCWDRCRGKDDWDDNEEVEKDGEGQPRDESSASRTTRPSTERTSLLESEKKKTLTSDLASQSESVDEMPDVSPYSSDRGTEATESQKSKSVIGSDASGSPRSSVSGTDQGSRKNSDQSGGSTGAASRSAVGTAATTRRSTKRPATIEEESEILGDDDATKEVSSDVDFDSSAADSKDEGDEKDKK